MTGDRPQPLCGIYTSVGLKKIYTMFAEGILSRYSMIHALEILDTKYLPAITEDFPSFNNYNSPNEL